MLTCAPRRQPITQVLGLIMMFLACSKPGGDKSAGDKPVGDRPAGNKPAATTDDKPALTGDDKPAPTADEAGAAVAVPAPSPSQPARTGLARRCVLGGAPLATECAGGGGRIAVGKDGLLYVVAGKEVRRYKRAEGTTGAAGAAGSASRTSAAGAAGSASTASAAIRECRFEPSGEPIQMPPDNPRPQSIDGPVYMRSGGAAWNVVAAGDAVYAHDFLGGLFRIDRGKPEPACEDVFGYGSVAVLGKRFLVVRRGIEELKLGKKCKAVSAKLDDKARGNLYAIGGTLYATSGSSLSRYDGATPTKLGEGTRICFASSLTACGDGVCLVDNNCMQVVQLGADGKVLRAIDDDKLFATRPYSLADAATSPGGDVYVLARHRDKTNNKEICEAAVYELPAAAFAL
jgi:hypothetical protein